MFNASPRNGSIVLEDHEPLLVERLLEDLALGLETDQRLYVVPHDPRERQVRMRRNDIPEVEGALPR